MTRRRIIGWAVAVLDGGKWRIVGEYPSDTKREAEDEIRDRYSYIDHWRTYYRPVPIYTPENRKGRGT